MKKKYQAMNIAELAKATARFDAPFVADDSRPLTADELAVWKKAKRKRGRPKTGQGFKRIAVSIEKGLLRKADALAKKRKINRSRLLATALESMMAHET